MATDTASEPTLEELADQEGAQDAPADPPKEAAKPEEAAEEAVEETTEEAQPSTERLKWLEEATGYRLSERYPDDDAVAEGVANAFKLIGQRSEDAALGRVLKEKLSPEQLERLVSGQDPAAAPPKEPADDDSDLPETYREYELLIERAEAAKGDPNSAEFRKAMKAVQAFSKRNFEAVRQFDELKAELAALKEGLTKQQQAFQASSEQQTVQGWMASHQQEFFQADNPSETTVLGRLVANAYENDPLCQEESPDSLKRWQIAYLVAQAKQPRPGGTRKPSKTAVQTPSTRKSAKKMSLDEMIEQGMSDDEALALINEQYLAEEQQ